MYKSKEYSSWQHMLERCYNSNNKRYKDYGGRGIGVCEEWKSSFLHFYKIMGGCPEGCSIDRINVNGNYEPENCRWATVLEQHNNTRRTKLYTYDNKTLTSKQWAMELGINYNTLRYRLSVWSIERAFEERIYGK